MTTQPDLQATRVAKHYGAFRAVDELSFSVARGSFFSILGPSGCGKTTLLRMIAGFLEPDAGNIQIGGKAMNGVPPNRRPVNMVFQHLALFPMMNVGENVGYGLARRGVAKDETKLRVGEMLERVSLAGAQAKRVDQLSGGQKQRVAIARSLVLEPTLLLLDEPLGALDLKLREHMKIELKALQAAFGTTFVYITHDQSEALVLSDHVAVMNHGRFEQLGTPQQLYYEPQTPFVAGFVGANNRIAGVATQINGLEVSVTSAEGLVIPARAIGKVSRGDAVEAFVRPEVARLARSAAVLMDAGLPTFSARVDSLLFDGANSAVLLREAQSNTEFRIALPQTGEFADLATAIAHDAVEGCGDRAFFNAAPRRIAVGAGRLDIGLRCGQLGFAQRQGLGGNKVFFAQAARALADVNAGAFAAKLGDQIGLPITEEKLAKVTVADIKLILSGEETVPDPFSDLDIAVSFEMPPETIDVYGCLYTEFSELFAPFAIDLVFIHEVDILFHYEIIKAVRIYEKSETIADEFEENVLKRAADLSFKKKEFDREVMEAIEDGYFQIEYSPNP